MGRITEYTCQSCGAAWRLQLGHGMGHASLEVVLEEFPEDIRQKILTDIREEEIPFFEFNYRPALCRQCGKMTSIPTVYLNRSGRTYVGRCPVCEEEAECLAEYRCPCCGKDSLAIDDVGFWD